MNNSSKEQRSAALKNVGNNVQLLSSESALFDLSTDSLMHRHDLEGMLEACPLKVDGSVGEACKSLLHRMFGFSHNIVTGQGRQAEALLSKLLLSKGVIVPTNTSFATTQFHQAMNGGQSVVMAVGEAFDPSSEFPFKGNLDLEELEKQLQEKTQAGVGYVCVELCNNGVGGQPCSLENLKQVRAITKKHGVLLVLDASRILENAFQIKEREAGYQERNVWEIVREICDQADAMTMSLTKDFLTPSGGLVAVRDEMLYQAGLDFMMAMGSGLSWAAEQGIARALKGAQTDLSVIKARMERVIQLHSGLADIGLNVLRPCGGHAVYCLTSELVPHLGEEDAPGQALNRAWYEQMGLRGSPHSLPTSNKDVSIPFIRLSVPIWGVSDDDIKSVLDGIKKWYPARTQTIGLKKISEPPVPGGSFRAVYECKNR